ncbi:MAG: PP2C family protein-serine/threonine phosphatase [Candidatus Krumholzibacteriota bacterium]|nr:PP2C family protein-serine/threonine phosphatase [Candidatus Krumholzibacteriota bacterium]
MVEPRLEPKAFYRKMDALLGEIERERGARNVLGRVLDELIGAIGPELRLGSGALYRLERGFYLLAHGPVGNGGNWPERIPRSDPAVKLMLRHHNYIFVDSIEPPWGNDSVAVLVGEDRYLMAFRLLDGWVRETLEFSLNTIRSTLNFSRSTSRMGADLDEATHIQRSLLPREDPEFEGFDIAGRFVMADRVGGDLYDFIDVAPDVIGFAIGDASGHGLPAALLARDVVTGLRMGTENEMRIAAVIEKLNRVIHQSRLSTRFVSLVYGELDRNGTVVYVNAGHPPPIIFTPEGEKELTAGGTILGPLPEARFKRGFAFLDPGDVMLLFTDGIYERIHGTGEMYTKAELVEFIRGLLDRPALTIIEELFKHLWHLGAEERWLDDATAVIIKRLT